MLGLKLNHVSKRGPSCWHKHISLRVISLPLGQSFDFSNASEATLKDKGIQITSIHKELWNNQQKNQAQQNCVHKLWDTLQWRHNGRDGVSNRQPRDCLLKRLFRCRSKKTSKLRVTGLCEGNSPGPVNSPHKGPVTRKMFPFDDVIMYTVSKWRYCLPGKFIIYKILGYHMTGITELFCFADWVTTTSIVKAMFYDSFL